MSNTGRVYFIQAGDNGPIKIGWTAGDPRARMASLQTGNPEPLRLLAYAPGTIEDERAMHERCASIRMIGEWFKPEPQLVAFAAGVQWARRDIPDDDDESPEDSGLPCGLSRSDLQEIANFVEARRCHSAAYRAVRRLESGEALDDATLTELWALEDELDLIATHGDDGARSFGVAALRAVQNRLLAALRARDDQEVG